MRPHVRRKPGHPYRATIEPLEARQLLSSYVLTDLGTLGGTASKAFGINDAGQVVGQANLTGDAAQHAFLYVNGTMRDLLSLSGTDSSGAAVNDAAQAVGSADAATGTHAFLYSGGMMRDLGTLGGTNSGAAGLNESGLVVGDSQTAIAGNRFHAFLWNNGTMMDLGTLGGPESHATGINDDGLAIGEADTLSGSTHAFVYGGGVMRDLGALGGSNSSAASINEAGQIVGQADTVSGNTHAFLYNNGTLTDLGTLGGSNSNADAVNDRGQIVGASDVVLAGMHAFVYANGAMRDLNSLIDPGSGWTLKEATGVNNWGQIVGFGTVNGQTHAFLLSPADASQGTALGSFGRVNGRNTKLSFTTAAGTLVTLTLNGGGTGQAFVSGGKVNLVLTGTSRGSTLLVRTKGGDGQVTLGNVRADGDIQSIFGRTANLAGTLSVRGSLANLFLGSDSGMVAAAGAIGNVTILGNLTNGYVLSGVDLGSDGLLGGSGTAADSFSAGFIRGLRVRGSISSSVIAAGLNGNDGPLPDADDKILGGSASFIRSVFAKGGADNSSLFVAGSFGTAWLAGAMVHLLTDSRFVKLGA